MPFPPWPNTKRTTRTRKHGCPQFSTGLKPKGKQPNMGTPILTCAPMAPPTSFFGQVMKCRWQHPSKGIAALRQAGRALKQLSRPFKSALPRPQRRAASIASYFGRIQLPPMVWWFGGSGPFSGGTSQCKWLSANLQLPNWWFGGYVRGHLSWLRKRNPKPAIESTN